MTAPVQVEVTGADEVARRFGVLSRSMENLQSTYEGVAQRVAADARAYAPKVSGALAAGIVGSATRRAAGATIRGVPYGGVINFGWQHRGIAAALFMQRAADSKGASTANEVATETQRRIDRSGLG